MANIFTPESSTNFAFEQPVAPVQETSFLEGIASTADNFLKAAVKGSGSSSKGSGSKVDPNLIKEFTVQAQQVRNIEDTKGSAAGSLARKKMMSAWQTRGIDLSDDAFKTVWEGTVGGKWANRIDSDEETMENSYLASAEGTAFYLSAKAKYPDNAPEDFIKQQAIVEASKFKANLQVVASYKAMTDADFVRTEGPEEIVRIQRESTRIQISAALTAIANGEVVTEGSILQMKALLEEQYKKWRPAGVSDNLLAAYDKEFDITKSQLTSIQQSVSAGTLKSGLIAEIAAKAKEYGFNAAQTLSFIAQASSDTNILNNPSIRDKMMKAINSNPDTKVFVSPGMQAYGRSAAETANGGSPDGSGATVSKVAQSYIDEVTKLDEPGVEALYDISSEAIKMSDVNTEPGAKAFSEGAMKIGAILQAKGTGLLPEDAMSKVFNDRFFENISKLYTRDPYQASIVAGSLRTGLQNEVNGHQDRLSSMLEKFPFVTEDESGGFRITSEDLEKHFRNTTTPAERADFMSATEGGNLEAVFAKRSWGKAQDILPHFPGMLNVLKLSAQRRNIKVAERNRDTIVSIINKRYEGSVNSDETLGAETPNLFQRSLSPDYATRNVKAAAAIDALTKPEHGGKEYEARNRGTDGKGKPLTSGSNSGKITELSHAEHIRRSKLGNDDKDRLFAIGKYQIIPSTAKEAFKALGLPSSTKYTKEVQDKMFSYIVSDKRKAIGSYITGASDDIEAAKLDWAKEWASAGVPKDTNGVSKGESYYGQNATISPDEVGKHLTTLREEYSKGQTGEAVAGKPLITAKVGADVVKGDMLGDIASSVRQALGLSSDEEAMSVAEKLMKSGVIPTRPDDDLSVDQPMRLPPVRGESENSLPPSNPRLAAAQLKQQSRDQANISLNSEALSQLDPGTAESLVRLGSPIAGLALRQLPWANAQAFGQYISKGKIDIKDVPLNDNDKTLLREKAAEALANGKNKLDYSSWGVTGKGVLVGGLVNTAYKTVSDANFRLATFLGQATVRKAANGDIIISDKYDFNPGPKGDKLKEALLAREMGDAATYEKLKEEALGGASWFEATRVWAATLKANDNPAEVFEINLGQ